MKMIASILDDIHTLAKEVERSTRRKKRIRREHIIGAFKFARVVANGVAAAVPKAMPIAVVLNGLNEAVVPKDEPKELDNAADG
jgi:hypothetical protein